MPGCTGERKLAAMTTFELHHHLLTLNAERVAASLEGLDNDAPYYADLLTEIEATRHALVGAAVTEIASFRAALSGPQIG
jgi:hypothetical protein